jgi:hypothetical protein
MASRKSFIYGTGISTDQVGDLPVTHHGIICLGAPESMSDAVIEQQVANLVEKATEALPALAHLKPRCAFTLLRQAINLRLQYTTRMVPHSAQIVDMFKAFDQRIDEAILSIIQCDRFQCSRYNAGAARHQGQILTAVTAYRIGWLGICTTWWPGRGSR